VLSGFWGEAVLARVETCNLLLPYYSRQLVVICEAIYVLSSFCITAGVILGWTQGLKKNKSMFGYIILSGQLYLLVDNHVVRF
jgi:hypothetical protein